MIPDWPKLWEREPALKPAHMSAGPHYVSHANADNIDAESLAALCRDAAVRWLVEKWGVSLTIDQDAGGWHIGHRGGEGEWTLIGSADTYDGALCNACAAELNVKG